MSRDLERDFTIFVESRTPRLFRTAMALTGDRQHAEDLLQTVLSRAYVRWKDVSGGEPEAYLRRAMYLQCVSKWRLRSYGREISTDTVPERGGDDESARVDLRLSLQAALRRLGPKQRAVIVLRYLEDLSDKQIADIVGCEPGTVRSQLNRGLARLRELCPELDQSLTRGNVS
jgi:RNA polymerase sigma-70 factor (sigma-E family)